MNNNFTVIDYNGWERRELFEFFSTMSNPFYSVTFNADITEAYDFSKREGLSFYCTLIWLITKAINSVETFRFALRGGELVLLDERQPSFTDLKKGGECFHVVTMPALGDIREFCREAKRRSASQTCFIDGESETDNLIYFSCLPWVELTALTNERDFDKNDSVPRVAWGKYQDEDGRKKLGLSLELNHRFVDGLHVGRFYGQLRRLQENLL